MLNVKLSGRIDVQATYSGTSLNQLHDWFTNVQEVETTYQNSDWAKKTQNALGFIKNTQTSVELALDFESLRLKWRAYRILCSMGKYPKFSVNGSSSLTILMQCVCHV
jgi:hypothetical protein